MSWSDVYFTGEWIVRVAMLFYVPQRRSPAAARTWLLLIFLLPLPGVLLYAVFGRVHMPRKRLEAQSRVSKFLQQRATGFFERVHALDGLPSRYREATRLARALGDFPAVSGNHVTLLPDYDDALARLEADVRAARDHVHLLYYIFGDDATARRIADALAEAAGRGVRCILLVDAHGSRPFLKKSAARLRAAGVDVRELLPVGLFRRNRARFDLRNHRKIAVIDGAVGYVGSQNVIAADFKPGLIFEELVARVTGPVVAQLQAVLLADYFFETDRRLEEPDRHFPAIESAGEVFAQTLPAGPGYQRENILRVITALVYAAQRSVVVTTPYFVPDETLQRALVTAAERGVDVRLIVSKQIDQFLVGFAQRAYYEELLEAGVKIYLYRDRFLHAKHLNVDDAVVQIGSSNMDLRSFALNAEVSLLVYDAELAAQLKRVEARRMEHAEQLTLEQWRRRPRWTQLLENTARLLDSLL